MSSTFDFDPPPGRLREQVQKSSVYTLIGQTVKFLIGIGPVVVLSRLLTPHDFGVFALATSITRVLEAIRECGLSSATIQAPKITHEQVSALFWLNLILGAVVAAITGVAGYVAADVMHEPALIWVVPLLGLFGLISSAGIQHEAILQRKLQFNSIVRRDLASQILGVAAGIIAAWRGLGLWSLLIMTAVSAIASSVSLWTASTWRPSRPRQLGIAFPMVKFGFAILGDRVLGQVTRGMDSLVIGYFHGTSSVGFYSRAQGLLNKPMTQALSPVMSVVRPALSRAAEDKQKFERVVLELLGLVSFGAGLMVCLLMPASEGIVQVLLGKEWITSAGIFAALTIFSLVEPCASLIAAALVASGNPGRVLKWRIPSVVIVLGGLAAAAPWGVVAIAYTYALSGLLVRTPLFLAYAAPSLGIPFRKLLGAVAPITLTAAIAAGAGLGLNQLLHALPTLASSSLAALAAGVLYLVGCSMVPTARKAMSRAYQSAKQTLVLFGEKFLRRKRSR